MLQNAKSSTNTNNNANNEDVGGGGAFQPFKPRTAGHVSPAEACVESTTKTDESDGKLNVEETAVDSSTPSTTTTERRKKKPYKELTLEEKVQLIRLAEENAGMSQASIAERYSIAKSNVCRILQRKHEYLRAYECAGFAGSRKRKLRGDPQQQQGSDSTSSGSFRAVRMESAVNCGAPCNRTSCAKLEAAGSQLTCGGRVANSRLIAPQRTTTIIQRGNTFSFLK